MSFRINDYNAFLKSLYDKKGNKEQNLENRDMQFKEDFDQESGQASTRMSSQPSTSTKNFPVDFDFGLFPLNTMESPSEPVDMAEFALESSLPDQSFDLYSSIPKKPHYQLPGLQFQQQQTQNEIQQQLIQNQIQPQDGSSLDTQPSIFSPMNSTMGGGGDSDSSYYIKQEFEELPIAEPTPHTRAWKSKSVTNVQLTREKYTPNAATARTMLPPLGSLGSRPRAKSSHNVIEQRYRNKINDRFTTLQNSVPTLRVISRRFSAEDGAEGDYEEDQGNSTGGDDNSDVDLEGLEPARKLSKGTILAKSVEYIKFLENKNSKLKLQQEELLSKARMLGLSIDEEDLCIS